MGTHDLVVRQRTVEVQTLLKARESAVMAPRREVELVVFPSELVVWPGTGAVFVYTGEEKEAALSALIRTLPYVRVLRG